VVTSRNIRETLKQRVRIRVYELLQTGSEIDAEEIGHHVLQRSLDLDLSNDDQLARFWRYVHSYVSDHTPRQ